jgi:hypothetical protein
MGSPRKRFKLRSQFECWALADDLRILLVEGSPEIGSLPDRNELSYKPDTKMAPRKDDCSEIDLTFGVAGNP